LPLFPPRPRTRDRAERAALHAFADSNGS
jgi:hypothetical protein